MKYLLTLLLFSSCASISMSYYDKKCNNIVYTTERMDLVDPKRFALLWKDSIQYFPLGGGDTMWIINRCHSMTTTTIHSEALLAWDLSCKPDNQKTSCNCETQ